MRILITGIAGLLGGNLARYLLEHTDHEVMGIDDLSCGLRDNIPELVPWHKRQLGRQGCGDVFKDFRPDLVYHFAAYAAECLSPFIRCYNYRNNVVATAEIVNQCIEHRVERLIFTSSMAVYGVGTPPFDEETACQPIDPYGVAKLACEMDIRIAGEQHHLDWCVLRPHNVFGPGQICTQKYRNVFGIWMHRYLARQPLLVYGDGQQQRAFSYIDDILPGLLLAGTDPAASRQVINLGGSRPTTILNAAEVLLDVMGGNGDICFEQGRHEVKHAWCTVEKSRRLLGYHDATTLRDGLERMWRWASTTRLLDTGLPEIELRAGLPAYWQ